ncbi:MAG: hypothetical protein J7K72_00805 [Candidatus Aenigmarchaeota archaeon]|nr:hypothetical protein [Candidatus Aenigmarchaeota archaeon]
MREKSHFITIGAAIVIGTISLLAAVAIFWILLPYILPLALDVLFLMVIFVALWTAIYIAAVTGIAMYYLFKPMKIEEKDKNYGIAKLKDSGSRRKGRSYRKRKKI